MTRRCRVITYGTVPWSKQQRTRVSVLDIDRLAPIAVRQFDVIRRALPVRRVERKASGTLAVADSEATAEFWHDVPQVPELAAENLIAARPWWHGFAHFVSDRDRRDHVFRWEQEGLHKMVNDPQTMPEGPEHTFIRACHEAWRRRLGQLRDRASGRATGQALDFQALASREYDKARVELSRCKTAAEFRRTITDFWARGGSQEELRQRWPAVLPYLVDDTKWALGRDLALLALASYAGSRATHDAPDSTNTPGQ